MVVRISEASQDSPGEVAEDQEVDIANGGAVVYDDGRVALANGWSLVPNGEGGRFEIRDENNDVAAYLDRDSEGNLLAAGGGDGGAPTDATYVTTDDESEGLENAQQHANLSGADLHDPAEHGSDAHDGSVAELNDNGVLLAGQVPDLTITDTYPVADESERLALDATQGDVAIQQDNDQSYILASDDASNDSNWYQLLFPEPPVDDVFGRTGSIQAQAGDYSYDQIDGTHGDEAHDEIDAATWNGYELHVQNSEPSTSEPYVRFEDE